MKWPQQLFTHQQKPRTFRRGPLFFSDFYPKIIKLPLCSPIQMIRLVKLNRMICIMTMISKKLALTWRAFFHVRHLAKNGNNSRFLQTQAHFFPQLLHLHLQPDHHLIRISVHYEKTRLLIILLKLIGRSRGAKHHVRQNLEFSSIFPENLH